jgi:Ser/Thr protein kinase RdoA (MazF antagonist)
VEAHAEVLAFLENEKYPAPRIRLTQDGHRTAEWKGWQALMTSFVPGSPPDYSTRALGLLGTALGRLHSLTPVRARCGVPLRLARLQPSIQIRRAIERLRMAWGAIPPAMHGAYSTVLFALEAMGDLQQLPQSVIHTDCYPGNAVHTSPNRVVLLNWSDAGIGPSLVDLGYSLLTCDTALPWAPELGPDSDRISAICRGYARHRAISPLELDALGDATRCVPAVRAANSFLDTCAGIVSSEQWKLWWSRYNAAEETATVARKHLKGNAAVH